MLNIFLPIRLGNNFILKKKVIIVYITEYNFSALLIYATGNTRKIMKSIFYDFERQENIYDIDSYAAGRREAEELKELYTPSSKCAKGKFRGPKTGQFVDCPQEQIEPFTPYTEVASLCYPYNPLDNAGVRENYTGYLKSKKWVSDKWKYSPSYKEEKKHCDECKYFDNFRTQTRSPLFLHTATDYELI